MLLVRQFSLFRFSNFSRNLNVLDLFRIPSDRWRYLATEPPLSDIPELIEHMKSVVSSMTPDDFVSHGQPLAADHAIIIKLDLSDLDKRFASIVGVERVNDFYTDCHPLEVDGTFHLGMPIAKIVFASIRYGDGLSLDEPFLLESFSRLADAIRAGEINYSISMRLVNIDIEDAFDIAPGIQFRKLPPHEILGKYPLNPQFTQLHPLATPHNDKHCVEAVVHGTVKLADAKKRMTVEQTDALVNSIRHTFLFSDVSDKCVPNVTHVLFQSDAESSNHDRGVSSFTFKPHLLTQNEIADVQKTYALLQDAERDRILSTVIDRFILGMKRGTHHPNRVNEPNWDKIVDYIIAMETLFLTVNGGEVIGELVYRFRMNGSSVISAATGQDREKVFDALNHLYSLRSKVVHGSEDSKILKPANKLIDLLGIDCKNHQHSLGRLMLVDRQVRDWLKKSILFVAAIKLEDRPYRKNHGWEYLVWNNAR
jgi:hypothetical protein